MRYLLFAWAKDCKYGPLCKAGGMNDFVRDFETPDDAINFFDPEERNLWVAHIADTHTMEIVKEYYLGFWSDNDG